MAFHRGKTCSGVGVGTGHCGLIRGLRGVRLGGKPLYLCLGDGNVRVFGRPGFLLVLGKPEAGAFDPLLQSAIACESVDVIAARPVGLLADQPCGILHVTGLLRKCRTSRSIGISSHPDCVIEKSTFFTPGLQVLIHSWRLRHRS